MCRYLLILFFVAFSGSNFGKCGEIDEALEEAEKLSNQEMVVGRDLHVGEYCAAFSVNYQYFCKGIWTPEKIRHNRRVLDKISQFCPSYKKACVTRGRDDDQEYNKERREQHTTEIKEEVGDLAFDSLMRRLQHLTPCRPNCDVTLHPHCTRQCKCKYEYKRVQKWCGGGDGDDSKSDEDEVERFKYFCRIWYMSCSQYVDDIDPDMAEQFAQAYNPRSSYYG